MSKTFHIFNFTSELEIKNTSIRYNIDLYIELYMIINNKIIFRKKYEY